MQSKVEYRVTGVHLKSVQTKAFVTGDSGTQIILQCKNLDADVLNFLNTIVSTPKNTSHELEIAFIAREEKDG